MGLTAEKSLLKKVWSKSMKKTVLIKRSGSDSFTSLRSSPLTGTVSSSSSGSSGGGGKKAKVSTSPATVNSDEVIFTPPANKKQKAPSAGPTGTSKKKGAKGKGRSKGGDSMEVEDSTNSDVDVEGGSTPMKVTGDDGPYTSKQVSNTLARPLDEIF